MASSVAALMGLRWHAQLLRDGGYARAIGVWRYYFSLLPGDTKLLLETRREGLTSSFGKPILALMQSTSQTLQSIATSSRGSVHHQWIRRVGYSLLMERSLPPEAIGQTAPG
ncbi:hypothetical protein F5Y18DRAFT_422896 [Xylariaceae sp. FL1019]|nr:hypothetical protein F5Y18DRAFT_422896 [Xylariaceae sp. FL1019]